MQRVQCVRTVNRTERVASEKKVERAGCVERVECEVRRTCRASGEVERAHAFAQ